MPILLALVGPPAQVIPEDDGDSLHQIDPPTPEPSPIMGGPSSATVRHHRTSSAHSSYAANRQNQTYHHNKTSRGLETRKNHISIPAKPPLAPTVPKRHNCSIESLSTIAEESLHSYASHQSECNGMYNGVGGYGYDKQPYPQNPYYGTQQESEKQQHHTPLSSSLTPSSSLNGASVFVEPHVVVETTTYPNSTNQYNVSIVSPKKLFYKKTLKTYIRVFALFKQLSPFLLECRKWQFFQMLNS